MKKRSRRKKAVPMTWKQFTKRLLQLIFASTWSALCLLRFLNPFLHIRRKLGYLNWTTTKGTTSHLQKSWLETLRNYFRSEEANRRQLLSWIQGQIPALRISNLSTSWCDGIALCALVDAICPGACPRYDLLKSGHRLNNCRLALKLAQKHLGVPQEVVIADEIADPSKQSVEKIQRLLSMIYYMFGNQRQSVGVVTYTTCTAKGSGLVMGVIGKKCNFNVIVPNHEQPRLVITVQGPNHEFHKEAITSLVNRTSQNKTKEPTRGAMLWKIGAAKVLKNYGNVSSENKNITFQYVETPEGHLDISYTPQSSGIYTVSIKWKDSNIKGSPFSVNILTSDKSKELSQTFPTINTCDDHSESNSCSESSAKPLSSSTNFLKASNALLQEKDPTCKNVATAVAILQRSSTLHRSISKISGPENRLKQGVVTRRKILKRIITKSGQEIIINAASMSSNSVSSQESDHTADETEKGSVDEAPKKREKPKDKQLLKSFDCEGAYESDSSSNTGEFLSPPGDLTKTNSKRKVGSDSSNIIVKDIVEILLQKTFTKIKRTEQIAMLKNKKRDFFDQAQEDSSSSRCVPFGRGKRHFSTSALLVPAFQKQFHCSPFTETHEILGKREPIAVDLFNEEDKELVEYRKKRLSRLSEPSLPSLDSFESNSKYDMKEVSNEVNFAGHNDETDNSLLLDVQASHLDSKSGEMMENTSSDVFLENVLDTNNDKGKPVIQANNVKILRTSEHLNIASSVSTDSSPRDTSSGTDSETHESGSVSIHPQLIESELTLPPANEVHLSRSLKSNGDVFNIQQDRSFYNGCWPSANCSRRKTASESELSSFNSSRASSLSRSYSMSQSSFSSQEDDIINCDPSLLKLLTSESMQKSCLYFSRSNVNESNPSFFESINSEQNQEENPMGDLDKVEKQVMEYNDVTNVVPSGKQDDFRKKSTNLIKLHVSRSWPNITVKWRALGNDPEKDPSQQEDVKTPKMLNNSDQKILKEDDVTTSIEMKAAPGDMKHQDETKNCVRSSSKESEGNKTTSRRGSLARQQEVMGSDNTTSESEEHSEQGDDVKESSAEPGNMDQRHTNFGETSSIPPYQLDSLHVTKYCNKTKEQYIDPTYENRMVNDICQRDTISASITPPRRMDEVTAKVDKSTQVVYSEIKDETGWVRPTHFLLPRRHPVLVEEMQKLFQSLDYRKGNVSYAEDKNVPLNINNPSVFVNNIERNTDARTWENIKQENQSCENPGKSTDDLNQIDAYNNTKLFCGEKYPNIFTNGDAPLPRRKQFVNGHKMLARNHYRGKIKLDPNLVSQDPNQINEIGILSGHSLLRKCVNTWTNSCHKTNRVINEKCCRRWKKQLGYKSRHGIRKRVKFSNRVLMYRRSSSRSTKGSLQNSKDSFKDSCPGSDQQNDEELTRMFQTFRPIQKETESCNSTEEILDVGSMITKPKSKYIENKINSNATNLNGQNWQPIGTSENNNLVYSSLDSDGFGVDICQRQELLKEVDQFRRLSLPLNNSIHCMENKSMDEDCIKAENNGTNTYDQHMTDNDHINNDKNISQFEYHHHDKRDFPDQTTPLGEDYISFTGFLDDSYHDRCISDKVIDFLDHAQQSEGEADDLNVPVPAHCIAFGSGLRYGQVGVKNNFQVRSLHAGNGSLGVSINGPRSHTVVETNVTYTGDDLYEVIYEVKYPGFYVITIKWADIDIPESPFICKVTF